MTDTANLEPPFAPGTQPEKAKKLVGLYGWAAFLGFLLVTGPIRALVETAKLEGSDLFKAMLASDVPAIHYYSVFLAAANLVNVGLLVFLAVMFFKHKKTFTKWFISYCLYCVAIGLVNVAWVYAVSGVIDDDTVASLFGNFFFWLWIPYLLRSKRLANTMVH